MIPRSYNQYCPLAHALDLVGDRWAMLIVRDLLLGPKRFTDLARGLPGIGTNILTARLREMEASGIVQQHVLPPPAASTVYELTSNGQGLYDAIAALAQWGERSLGNPQPGQIVSPDSLMLSIQALFQRALGSEIPTSFQVNVHVMEHVYPFSVTLRRETVVITPGRVQQPAMTLETDVTTLYSLSGGQMTVAMAQQQGMLHLKGSDKDIASFGEAFL